MSYSHDVLIALLASRHELYVQLGLIKKHVAATRRRPASGAPAGDSAVMRDLARRLHGQIEEIDRLISGFKGPIPDDAPPEAAAA